MQRDSRAKGFALVGVLVSAAVLVVIGGTGLYVYHDEPFPLRPSTSA
jgi:Tfp pilus assembly protein PilV